MDYKQAGVDIYQAEGWVSLLQKKLETSNQKILSKIGDYAAIYEIREDCCITATTDGVGTKIMIAMALGIHDTIGIDLVAMNVNDLLAVGSRPLFMLDYMALGSGLNSVKGEILEGILKGCRISGITLIGGETAQMPDLYRAGEYDLAAFCVGDVSKGDIIKGEKITPGDIVVGIPSSGFHSNGYTLLRKLVGMHEKDLLRTLLTPTRIYTKEILNILSNFKSEITGLAHITGSGYRNLFRLNPNVGFNLNIFPTPNSCFQEIQNRGQLSSNEMFSTFNMGFGFIIIVKKASPLIQQLHSYIADATVLGDVTAEAGQFTIPHLSVTLQA